MLFILCKPFLQDVHHPFFIGLRLPNNSVRWHTPPRFLIPYAEVAHVMARHRGKPLSVPGIYYSQGKLIVFIKCLLHENYEVLQQRIFCHLFFSFLLLYESRMRFYRLSQERFYLVI